MIDSVERMPPNSRTAERCVLGSMLRDNATIDDLSPILRAEDFYADAHQKIFAAMTSRFSRGGPVDLVLLADDLKTRDQVEDVGGYAYLAELWDAAPTAANAVYYAGIVREKAVARSLIHAATELLRDAYDTKLPTEELIDGAEAALYRIAERRIACAEPESLEQGVGQVYDLIDSRARSCSLVGVPSGFLALDHITTGFRPGDLVVVAARLSVGKTAFAGALALGAAKGDCRAFFVSLEQTRSELIERMLVSEAQVNSHKVRRGLLSHIEVVDLKEAGERLKRLGVWIDDTHSQTVQRIASAARRARRRHDVGIVFIDYLQRIVPESGRASREEKVAELARRLKDLARELQIPVVCLAQLNRESEKRSSHVPIISDIRESDAIAQEADLVMLLHRPELYGDRAGEVDVIVAKQRNGPVGTVTLSFAKEFMRFADMQGEAQPRFEATR